MIDQTLDCLTEADAGALPLHTVRPDALEAFAAGQPAACQAWLRQTGFAAKAGELRLLPGPDGLCGAALGLGDDHSPHVFGGLPHLLRHFHLVRFTTATPITEHDEVQGFRRGTLPQ